MYLFLRSFFFKMFRHPTIHSLGHWEWTHLVGEWKAGCLFHVYFSFFPFRFRVV